MIFDFGKKNAFGLDISDLQAKLILLGGSIDSPKLLAMGKLNLPEGTVQDGKVIQKERLKQSLLELIQNPDFGKIFDKRCIFSLGESKIFYHIFSIPENLDLEKEKKLIRNKLAEVFPFSEEEIYFDWKLKKEGKGKKEILISATPKKVLDGFLEVLKNLKIGILAIENEAQSLNRSLMVPGNEVKMIMDCGAKITHFLIFDEDGFKLSASISIAGEKFTQSLKEKFNLSLKEAERLKKEGGLNPQFEQGRVFLILQRDVQAIIWEIRKIEDYFQKKEKRKIEKIILTGGSSLLPFLKEYLKENLKKDVEIGDPWKNIDISILKKKEYFKKALKINPNSYSSAIGSSLRALLKNPERQGINFLQKI